jgi:hypothetical protein
MCSHCSRQFVEYNCLNPEQQTYILFIYFTFCLIRMRCISNIFPTNSGTIDTMLRYISGSLKKYSIPLEGPQLNVFLLHCRLLPLKTQQLIKGTCQQRKSFFQVVIYCIHSLLYIVYNLLTILHMSC